jgi:hypothetical protein
MASAALWGTIAGIITLIALSAMFIPQVVVWVSMNVSFAAIVPSMIVVVCILFPTVWLLQATSAFRRAAKAKSASNVHFARGFTKLRNCFLMVGILLIIGIAFALVTGVLRAGSGM